MPKKLETERPWRKMKQVVQRLDSGETQIIEAPAPANAAGHLLIRPTATLISAGTERMLVDFGKSSMLAKARPHPERVKEVLANVRTDGLVTTLDAVGYKLGQPIPLGYRNVGAVTAIGADLAGFTVDIGS